MEQAAVCFIGDTFFFLLFCIESRESLLSISTLYCGTDCGMFYRWYIVLSTPQPPSPAQLCRILSKVDTWSPLATGLIMALWSTSPALTLCTSCRGLPTLCVRTASGRTASLHVNVSRVCWDWYFILRVSNQNGVSSLYIMLEIHHSGWELSNFLKLDVLNWELASPLHVKVRSLCCVIGMPFLELNILN